MSTRIHPGKLWGVLIVALAAAWLVAPNAFAQKEAKVSSVADKLTEALSFYAAAEFEKGLAIANDQLKRKDLTQGDSIAVYETLSLLTYGMGEKYRGKAVSYLETMAKIGPCVLRLPRELWPPELRDRWYRITQAAGMLTCADQIAGPTVKTIAIMQFDNYSVGKYQEQLGLISKGLADMFAMDFAKVSDLKVVERDKINFVLKEIELQQSGNVDQATAVRVGKILGAQYMVFGSITQLDERTTRMVVRVVKVETSEIVASVDKEGKPDYFDMEKGLVAELSQKLDVTLSDKARQLLQEGGTSSSDATTFYSKGLDYMDKYDYKNAYENFKKAYEADPKFVEAKRKMDLYRPLVG
ncbi:MAG: CsgG/HfaB family protein [Candidatus Zixiibacteriota bacterium]